MTDRSTGPVGNVPLNRAFFIFGCAFFEPSGPCWGEAALWGGLGGRVGYG